MESDHTTPLKDEIFHQQLLNVGDAVAVVQTSTCSVGDDKPKSTSKESANVESKLTRMHIEKLARTSGRKAMKENVKLFLKFLVPISVVSLSMFGMYAIISYSVPNLLCDDVAHELSGSSLGISSCVYVTSGKYSPWSGAKFFWLLFWSVQNAWVPIFPGFVCFALFGKHMSRFQKIVTIGCGLGSFATSFILGLAFGISLNSYYIFAVSVLSALVVNITCSSAAVRYTGDRLMRWRWILLFGFAGQVTSFYYFIIPRIITARAQNAMLGQGLAFVRIFVHPMFWLVVLFFFRSLQRHIGRVENLTQTCFLVWPLLYSSLYGRFLLLQLEGLGSIVVINLIISCFSISSSLEERGKDNFWIKFLYGKRAKDALMATRDVEEMALVDHLSYSMMEASSILAATALLSFGKITSISGVPPDHTRLWTNAALQMATELLFGFAEVVALGKFHSIEWRKVFPASQFRFLSYVMAVLLIGGSRLCVELLLLFCPKVYDEHGILLELCDRPSLFQAISFAFENRARTSTVGSWLAMASQNGRNTTNPLGINF